MSGHLQTSCQGNQTLIFIRRMWARLGTTPTCCRHATLRQACCLSHFIASSWQPPPSLPSCPGCAACCHTRAATHPCPLLPQTSTHRRQTCLSLARPGRDPGWHWGRPACAGPRCRRPARCRCLWSGALGWVGLGRLDWEVDKSWQLTHQLQGARCLLCSMLWARLTSPTVQGPHPRCRAGWPPLWCGPAAEDRRRQRLAGGVGRPAGPACVGLAAPPLPHRRTSQPGAAQQGQCASRGAAPPAHGGARPAARRQPAGEQSMMVVGGGRSANVQAEGISFRD